MALRALPQRRALTAPRQLDRRLVFGALLCVIGVVGVLNLVGMAGPQDRTVVIAAHDLPAGQVLQASDLSTAQVRIPDTMAQQTWSSDELSSLVGRQLGLPVAAKALIGPAQLTASDSVLAPDQVIDQIPLRSDSAVVDRIQKGDTVAILVSIPDGKPNAGTRTVVPRATVARVGRDSARAAGASSASSTSLTSLDVILTLDQASAVADARTNGDLTILLAGPGQ
jgi:Flp pilus assembly protein CpaB